MNKNILIVVLFIIIGIFAFRAFKTKNVPTPTQPQTTEITSSKTYTNTQYGFSFEYPNNWKVTENTTKKEVTIDTNDVAFQGDGYVSYPSWSITFKATDKSFFNPPIGTKYGMITYDEIQSALVDGDRCLKSEKLLGNFEGNTTSVESIQYGGSLMSDPAYSNSAILTNNGNIIIVNSEQGSELTPELTKQLSQIANSFTLLNGNTVFVPTCAKQ